MRVKALKSFTGLISMRAGEEKEVENECFAEDLLRAGYVVKIESIKKGRREKANENK